MVSLDRLIAQIPDPILLAGIVLSLGLVLGYIANRINRRLLTRAGVPETVEGTAFERTARGVGTSTVAIISQLSMWFIVGVSILAALSVADVRFTAQFWGQLTGFLPEFFVAILVLIIGIVVGDKCELVVSERLRGIKIPQVGILPRLVNYSVVYIFVLIALGQIGVATIALVVLLGGYFLAVIVFSAVAFRDLLRSSAAGLYLLLNQPYGIGDEVHIADHEGIVQEVTVLVTRIEGDDGEYVVPNRRVFEQGFVRIRHD